MDTEAELKKLHAELAYAEGFLQSVQKKLSNERFVQNAKPEIVESERKKQADAESKITLLKENIAALSYKL
jgi:valyl-tRNA synthetase